VVESYYRPTDAWSSIWLWHIIYFILYVGIVIFMALRLRSLIPLSIIIAFVFGIEDTIFYALQSTLPARYVGVEILGVWQPSSATALTFNLLGLILICLFLVTVSNFEHSKSR
jgi:phosphoglycerol transferase MdoB-like AlkP superfamily enzyme